LKQLITFSHDKASNIGNLSRIDPSLLGVKDANTYGNKNALYLHGVSPAPLLCFSLVLVMSDSHQHGRTFGADNDWMIKDVAGVLLTMELERLISVLGLVYELPYVPDDSARREQGLLHISMIGNAFCFTTRMARKSGKSCLRLDIENPFIYI
jgi:hypothetical protein